MGVAPTSSCWFLAGSILQEYGITWCHVWIYQWFHILGPWCRLVTWACHTWESGDNDAQVMISIARMTIIVQPKEFHIESPMGLWPPDFNWFITRGYELLLKKIHFMTFFTLCIIFNTNYTKFTYDSVWFGMIEIKTGNPLAMYER